MNKSSRKTEPEGRKDGCTKYVLRLFLADDEPNSIQARANLTKLCEAHLKGECRCCQLEVVDVLKDFETALKNNILLTPTLLVVAPRPVTILGNLRDTGKALAALGLTGG
jgi:circadian clock protein KaiB